jgi:hypothetical protein
MMSTPTLGQRWADLFDMIQRAQAGIPGASEQALVAVRFIAEDLRQAYTQPAAPRPASAALQDLIAAARTALDEMVQTVAPRNSFTDAVDALDAALAAISRADQP